MKFGLRLLCFFSLLSSFNLFSELQNKEQIKSFLLSLHQDLYNRSVEGKYSRYNIKGLEKEFNFLRIIAEELLEQKKSFKNCDTFDIEKAINSIFNTGNIHEEKDAICDYLETESPNSLISEYFSCVGNRKVPPRSKELKGIFTEHVVNAYVTLNKAYTVVPVKKKSTNYCTIF